MGAPRVLVLNDHHDLAASLCESLRRSAPEINVSTARRVTELIDRLAQDSFDAVLCVAESEDELAVLVRIRKQNPELPVLLLTNPADPKLNPLSKNLGATWILDRMSDSLTLVESIRQVLSLRRSTGLLKTELARSHSLAQDLLELTQRTKALAEAAHERAQRSYNRLVPLLVEDEPQSAFQMIQAFAKVGMPFPLPVMKSVEEAISYFLGLEQYADRVRFPLPSVLLLNFNAGGEDPLRFLRWIRTESPRRHLPVIVLSASEDPSDRWKAYELGANSFLVKPAESEKLVELVRGIGTYWTSINLGLDV